MFGTPVGYRSIFDYEAEMLREGIHILISLIKKNIAAYRDKNLEMVNIQTIKGDSPFLSLPPSIQITFLQKVMVDFTDQTQRQMCQHTNSALECVYSCIFYEIKNEVADQLISKSKKTKMRNLVSHTAMSIFPNTPAIPPYETNLDKWVQIVDKLAAHTVFTQEVANNFPRVAA